MSKTKIVLNKSGVRQFLREDMAPIVEAHAQEIANRCGSGYEVSTHVGKNRANASVVATTFSARLDNNKNNTILRNLL